MDAQERYDYWLEIAEYDFVTAQAMLDSKRWLYVVFMCQQAIEKHVKGLYTLYVNDEVPRTHNVRALVSRFESELQTPVPEEKMELFDELSAYYLNNRYPDFMAKLSAQIKKDEAERIFSQTKEAFEWLRTLKP